MHCNNCNVENEEGLEVCRSCGLGLFTEQVVNDGAPGEAVAEAGVLYAGFWKRAAAALIDSFVLFIVGTVLGLFFILMTGSEEGLEAASNILGIIIGWLYFAFMESSEAQATFGKRALGLVVIDAHGKRISFYRASGRHFSKIVSAFTFCIGFVMAGFTKKKQTLHDMMFDCLVVVKNRPLAPPAR